MRIVFLLSGRVSDSRERRRPVHGDGPLEPLIDGHVDWYIDVGSSALLKFHDERLLAS